MTYESLVYDEEVIKRFHSLVLKDITDTEINFLSVAARNKYLSSEERSEIRLGHTCMLGKTIIKINDSKKYLDKVLQLDAASNFYTDFNGNYLPRKCMVIYANINPTSVPKATYEFKKIIDDYDKEALCLLNINDSNRNYNLMNRYKNLYNNLMTCYQTQRSRKRWIDIDCDVDESIDVVEMFEYAKDFCKTNKKFNEVSPIGIITHGGLHILLNTNGLEDNPQKIVNNLQNFVKSKDGDYKEILINKNEMIPLPGTLQGNKEVIMLE